MHPVSFTHLFPERSLFLGYFIASAAEGENGGNGGDDRGGGCWLCAGDDLLTMDGSRGKNHCLYSDSTH